MEDDELKSVIKDAVNLAHKLPKGKFVQLFVHEKSIDYIELSPRDRFGGEHIIKLYKIKAKNEDSIKKIFDKVKSMNVEIDE